METYDLQKESSRNNAGAIVGGIEPVSNHFLKVIYQCSEDLFDDKHPYTQSVEKQRTVRLSRQMVLVGGIEPITNHFRPHLD